MAEGGLTITPDSDGGARLEAKCEHQHGLLYVVNGNMNWVCDQDHRPAHSLAGFFRDLVQLNDSGVTDLMRRWGLYFRELPLESHQQGQAS